ncbi:hypothetical protein VNO77_05104 [Canavalia gladiata]|uniref:Uncharacterized protein n=1 Tax=Canavalia gladiata TaxID=3824 RepID=A0AAN9N3F1_CANGL
MYQNHTHNVWLLNSFILFLIFSVCACSDTISADKAIRDGELLVSKDKTFALGFFSPGKSTSRYVGIWYNNLSEKTVVWVANRDNPINDTSGVLSINPHGNLVIHHNNTTFPIWSTNVSLTQSNTTNVIAQLSDIANLVLFVNHTKTVIWQSFDHPTDTMLPYLKIGFDKRTNQSWFFQSWKTEDDPGTGSYTLKFSTSGKPQLLLYRRNSPWWRGESWNSKFFAGVPSMKRDMLTFNVSFVEDDNQVAGSFHPFDKSVISRAVVQQSGFFQMFTWDNQKSQWNRYWSVPTNQCDNYGTCGSNSNCDPFNFENFRCTCLLGFEPKFPHDWNGGSGCLAWHGNLVDTQKLSDQGQDLFVRVDAAELDFGMARIFGEDQIQAKTKRVVGTYGYMSPEYAMEGRYSTKSDVFSFGVILLEIIAGKRNTDFEIGRVSPNLIGYVWTLWTEQMALDIVDSTLGQSYPTGLVLRCIQIGLLCLQENAINRPSMLEVVFMLGSETPLWPPQKPAFLFNGNQDLQESSTSGKGSSINVITETTISAR